MKVDQDQDSPEDFITKIVCNAFPVLPYEIKIADPHVVVFLTSHHYDETLKLVFNGLRFDTVEGFSRELLSRVVHDELPESSFRTYHPGYLQRSRQLEMVLNKIAELSKVPKL